MQSFLHVITEYLAWREPLLRCGTPMLPFRQTALGFPSACAISFELVLPRWTRFSIAHNAGALGARLTGAGFGGSVVIL